MSSVTAQWPVAPMVDGMRFGEHTCVIAQGIGIDGTKPRRRPPAIPERGKIPDTPCA